MIVLTNRSPILHQPPAYPLFSIILSRYPDDINANHFITISNMTALGREVSRLRNDNRDLRGHTEELRELPLIKERELLTAQQAIAAALRQRNTADEAVEHEKRKGKGQEELIRWVYYSISHHH